MITIEPLARLCLRSAKVGAFKNHQHFPVENSFPHHSQGRASSFETIFFLGFTHYPLGLFLHFQSTYNVSRIARRLPGVH